jgi:L-lactate dehydrogenase complex protein LldG
MSARENILGRIREAQGRSGAPDAQERAAVAAHLATHPEGPRPGSPADVIAGFSACAAKLTTSVDQVATMADVPQAVARYLEANKLPKNAVCWPELFELEWQAAGVEIEARAAEGTDLVGITSAFCAIAETGTLLTLSGPRTPATTSLLPETHIAIVRTGRMVRSMEDAWKLLRDEQGANFMPRAANFISGPSRTADIEQTLVLGAHGPYRVHIVLVG